MGHIQLDNEDYHRIDDRLHRCILLQVYMVDGNEWWSEVVLLRPKQAVEGRLLDSVVAEDSTLQRI